MLFDTDCLDDSKNITFPCMCVVNKQQNRINDKTVNNFVSPQENIHIELEPTVGFL